MRKNEHMAMKTKVTTTGEKVLLGLSRSSAEVDPKGRRANIAIRFGASYPPIAVQLRDQGFIYDKVVGVTWEEHRQAILRLSLAGLLTYNETSKLFDRLMKRICRHRSPKKK